MYGLDVGLMGQQPVGGDVTSLLDAYRFPPDPEQLMCSHFDYSSAPPAEPDQPMCVDVEEDRLMPELCEYDEHDVAVAEKLIWGDEPLEGLSLSFMAPTDQRQEDANKLLRVPMSPGGTAGARTSPSTPKVVGRELPRLYNLFPAESPK